MIFVLPEKAIFVIPMRMDFGQTLMIINMLKQIIIGCCVLLIGLITVAEVNACSSDHPIWQVRDKRADPYYRFIRNGKAGYINQTGKIVVQPSSNINCCYNSGGEFHDGLLLTGLSDGPYIDTSGKVVLHTRLKRKWDFSDGLTAAMKDNHWGFINKARNFVIAPTFRTYPNGYVYPFSDGLAMIKVDDKYGFIDKTGKIVIDPTLSWAQGFQEDLARVISTCR